MTETTEKPVTDLHPVEDLIDAIKSAREEDLRGRIFKPTTQPYLYMGSIHSCARHNVYLLTEGDKRPPVDTWLQAKFDVGNDVEDRLIAWLSRQGFEIAERQKRVTIEKNGKTIASGKIDGIMRWRGKSQTLEKPALIPFEIKSMNPNAWGRINSLDDLLKHVFYEKYVRQLLMYLYANGLEAGFFLLDDCQGHYKLIPVYLGNHLDYAEKTLRLIEEAAAAVEKKEIPPHTEKVWLCERCPFVSICLPDKVIEGGDRIDDDEEKDRLARQAELEPLAKEYEQLKEQTKEVYGERGTTNVCGHFEVRVSEVKTKRIDMNLIPDDVKAAAKVESVQKRIKVRRLVEDAK